VTSATKGIHFLRVNISTAVGLLREFSRGGTIVIGVAEVQTVYASAAQASESGSPFGLSCGRIQEP